MRHAFYDRHSIDFQTSIHHDAVERTVSISKSEPRAWVPPMMSASVEEVEVSTVEVSVVLSKALSHARFFGCQDMEVETIAYDFRNCSEGETVLYRVGQDEPTEFVATVLARGASGIITEQMLPCPLPQCVVSSVDHALAKIAAKRNNRPDRRLLTVGVLGSSGKTSTCLMLATMMKSFGMRVAYQSDLGSSDGVMSETAGQALPRGEQLINWLGESADCMSRAAIIEIDDQIARNGGYDCIQFDVLIVAGKDAPGEDFGPSSLQCMADRLTPSGVIIAPEGNERIDQVVAQAECQSLGYGTTTGCEFGANIIDQSGGMSTIMLSAGDTSAMMETSLCGHAMAANIAAASTLGVLLGYSVHQVAESLSTLRSIPGRAQRLADFGRATVVLENGGRPDRIFASLRTARATTVGGKVWCVLSLGDFANSNELARVGAMIERHAHRCIVTGDSDDAAFLQRAHQLLDGVKECAAIRLVADNQKALRWAIRHADPRDTIVVFTNQKATSPHQDRLVWSEIESWVEDERKSVEVADASSPQATKISLKLYR
ncbi:hypothetical protein LOC67_14970 [Stieleria sp. JC731]|uniref:glutamate ligase domain-containing protein n=1 Tax=Pirellulaceae TaxID=2691357 RepID=UPI001E2DEB50|nr:hypothetical protein [Stieleria sp. JC731]MCC9601861.1 hypothetical protein [Stieleria sp. JC731]